MKKRKRIAAGIVAAVCLGVLIWKAPLLASALWDESTAVHIQPADVESATLIIGTHLIHLSALNDELYEVAKASAEESGQQKTYYKSELGGNSWFDITTASTLEDITTGGTPVEDAQIQALFFTHHTKSDGVTYDLRTGQPVNLFDIHNPYDLESLDELSPLKMQYDTIRQMQGESDVTKRIDRIWQTPVSTPPADAEVQGLLTSTEYDTILAQLNEYLTVLRSNNGEEAAIEKVNGVMSSVDACRRYLVYANLAPALQTYLDELGAQGTADVPMEDDSTVSVMTTNPELLSAVSESLSNVQNAMITYSGEMLSQGVTVISGLQYEYSNDLINHAKERNHAACDEDVQKLILLDNIMNDVIAKREEETALLSDTLIPRATMAYTDQIWRGENAEYVAAIQNNSAQALLETLRSETTGAADTTRGELEFLIQAWCSRVEAATAMTFLDDRLVLASGDFMQKIPADDFQAGMADSVQAHIDFLTSLRRDLELAMGGNEMDQLMAQKDDLQQERLSALDSNDLAAAQALEQQINEIQQAMDEMEQSQADSINELQAQVAQLQEQLAQSPQSQTLQEQLANAQAALSTAQAGLSDGSMYAMVEDLKQTALDEIGWNGLLGEATGSSSGTGTGTGSTQAGGTDDGTLQNAVQALIDQLPTSGTLVLPALQEVHDALVLSGKDQGLVDAIEQAILDNPQSLAAEKTAKELQNLINQYFAQQNEQTGAGTATGGAGAGTGSNAGTGGNTGTGSGAGGNAGAAGSTGTTGGTSASGGTTAAGGTGGAGNSQSTQAASGLSGLSEEQAIAAIAALELYVQQTGDEAAKGLMGALGQQQIALGNSAVFRRLDDPTGEYVPLSAIHQLTPWRYVWDKNRSMGVLAQGAEYYGFQLYSTTVLRNEDNKKNEAMPRAAKYLEGLHIPAEYALETFGVQTLYLQGTEYGCVCTEQVMQTAQELLAILMQ